uniref:Si:ch211-63p21.8 n=1 Tax=Acanthochromis polyacanthus TaxID=80966 RepID=A0A3Q1GR30_9TELE
MEFTRRYLPMEWEERWRREKERRKRVIDEGGEGIEQDNRELRRIVAYNDSRMGLTSGRENKELTDLTLTTQNGNTFHVHSLILAAVSGFVLERLKDKSREQNVEQSDRNEDVGVERWSVHLGAGVDHVGLWAVVEFAYTGVVLSLNKDTMAQIKAAAQVLVVPRLVEICNKKERTKEVDGAKKEEQTISTLEQMKITLQSIEQLWADRVGCDVTLNVDGMVFHHKVILAASSDYFRGMFTCGMKESRQTCVELPFLLAPEFEALLGCSYSGILRLGWDSVFEITCRALQLQFQPALSICLNFMQQEIQADSCLDVASFAEAYGMSDLLEEANDFVLRNFREVSSTAKFQDLAAEKLLDFLCCDGLCVPSELTVFRAVISWIEADPEERLPQAGLLMTGVRFPLMTFREFREVRAINLRMECFGEKEVELYGSALKEFGFSLPKSQDYCRVRRPKDVVVLVGGDQLHPDTGHRIPSRELWFANSLRSGTGLVKEIEWRSLGEIPDKPKFRHGVAVMEGMLYVVGGCYFYAKNDMMKSAYYDPVKDSWKRLADMQELRSNFSVVVLQERLYAVGGDKEINANIDSVEMYNPDTESWSFVLPLDQALSGYGVSILNEGIFISGGFNCKYVCLVSMFLYHPERGTTYLADMTNDRAQHCMEALQGHLYVAGGVCNLRKFYTDQQACEVYDPVADAWTAFASLPVPHVGAASVILEEKFYVLGGYCQDDYSESGLVHRFNPSTQRWENMGKLSGAVTDVRACLLRLPQHLRQ